MISENFPENFLKKFKSSVRVNTVSLVLPVETQNKILAATSKKEIDAMAKKWLSTERMNILLVGDKSRILPGLQKLGFEIVELDTDGNKK